MTADDLRRAEEVIGCLDADWENPWSHEDIAALKAVLAAARETQK